MVREYLFAACELNPPISPFPKLTGEEVCWIISATCHNVDIKEPLGIAARLRWPWFEFGEKYDGPGALR